MNRTKGIRGVVVPGVGALVVLGLAAGAVWDARRTADGAERSLPADHGLTAIPEEERGLRADPGADHTELSAALLPVPDGYTLGPDIDEHGNDAEMSGEEATAMLLDAAADWPREYRRALEDDLAEAELAGVALRSYARRQADLVVRITLTRYGSDDVAAAGHADMRESLGAHELFRAGPELTAYPDAACAHLPRGDDWLRFMELDPEDFQDEEDEDHEQRLDRLVCTAAVGPYHVVAHAQGTEPLAAKAATNLFENQLDHIDSPGTSV